MDHRHSDVRDNLKLSKNFVVNSLRHAANEWQRVVEEVVKVENGSPRESAQMFEFKRTGP